MTWRDAVIALVLGLSLCAVCLLALWIALRIVHA